LNVRRHSLSSRAIIRDGTMNDKLDQESEAIVVESPAVACDGGGTLGHPRVFLRIGPAGEIVCPYCSRRFVLADLPSPAGAGSAKAGGAGSDAGH
jgi:uncharacterized Zn-finger protein